MGDQATGPAKDSFQGITTSIERARLQEVFSSTKIARFGAIRLGK